MTKKEEEKEDKKRYNVHFRLKGFMVLDYEATPEMGNIYDGPKDYQMVIADVSQPEARRVCNFLNEKEDRINELEQDLQDYEDTVANFLYENRKLFNEDQIRQIDNELGIDLISMIGADEL